LAIDNVKSACIILLFFLVHKNVESTTLIHQLEQLIAMDEETCIL